MLALLGTLLAACAVGDEQSLDAGSVERGGGELNGRVAHLTITTRNALGREAVPVTAAAQFVQFDGVEDNTVRRSLDLWTPPAGLSDGECLLSGEATMLDPRDWYTSRIDLLHAGELHLASARQGIDLAPRPMPDLLPYLGGYTYGTDGRQPFRYEPELELAIWSDGGDQVGAFAVDIALPPPISLAFVGGVAVGSAETIDVALDDDLLVLWEPAGSEEMVYLVLEEDGLDPGPLMTCAAYDDGAFRVPRASIEALRRDGSTSGMRLAIRRARVTDLGLPDFDQAEAVAITEHSIVLY